MESFIIMLLRECSAVMWYTYVSSSEMPGKLIVVDGNSKPEMDIYSDIIVGIDWIKQVCTQEQLAEYIVMRFSGKVRRVETYYIISPSQVYDMNGHVRTIIYNRNYWNEDDYKGINPMWNPTFTTSRDSSSASGLSTYIWGNVSA